MVLISIISPRTGTSPNAQRMERTLAASVLKGGTASGPLNSIIGARFAKLSLLSGLPDTSRFHDCGRFLSR